MIFISIVAVIISSYLLSLHYSEGESFCDISAGFSCDIVNKSEYSVFPPGNGIPVSLMGALTFLFVIILLLLIKHEKTVKIGSRLFNKKTFSNIIFYLMTIGFIFSLYLLYAELFLILSVCILCVVLDVIIITMIILSYKLRRFAHEN